MPVYRGGQRIAALHLGARKVLRVYQGSTLMHKPAPLAPQFLASISDSANAAAYTFSSVSIGAAAASRRIVVGALTPGGALNIDAISIGGVAADLLPGFALARMAVAHVPAGTAANIVVQTAASGSRCGIGVWRIDGLEDNAPYDTLAAQGNPAASGNIGIPDGGVVIACGAFGGVTAHEWDGVAEDFNVLIESALQMSGGFDAPSHPDPARALTVEGAASVQLIAASWGPP